MSHLPRAPDAGTSVSDLAAPPGPFPIRDAPARSLSGLDEPALVRKAQAGDADAFEQLVRGTARMLYARHYLECGDRDKADDLVQETYLTAWKSINQLHDVTDASAFRRWLFAIGRTVRIDAGRRQNRKKRSGLRLVSETEEDNPLSETADPADTPAESVERKERQSQALSLLKTLPDEYRLPIAMRYLAGAEYETICRQLGLTNGSLRGLLNRGMTRLRALLGRAAIENEWRMINGK